jgi:PAS domain S-box-containing protein
MIEQVRTLHVAIVGGGPGCKAIMDMIFDKTLSQLRMKLIGLACTNPKAEGYRYALEKGIPTTTDYRDLYALKGLNMIIELTGREEVVREICRTKPDHVRLIDHVAARLFWDIFHIQEKRIAERQCAEEALHQSEEKYSRLVENSLTGIYIDQGGKIVFANRRFAEIYGYSREELAGMESWRLVHPEDRVLVSQIRTKRLKGEDAPSEYEARGLTKDGRIIWINRRNARIEYNGTPAVLGNVVDITKRKRMERALRESGKRLQFLSSNLLTAQERERRRISIELHDELGQALAVLKLQLRSIETRLRKDQKGLRGDFEHVLRYIDQIIENVRRLSRDMSPSILEDLGLSAALRWVIDDVSRHHGVETSVEMDDIKHLFSQEAQIIIYRVFQEALANAGKHAYATNVSVAIEKTDGIVSFMLEDNGKGFDVEYVRAQASTEKGLGLAAMDERVRMLGGSLNIWSKKGTGTKITFTVPVDEGGNQ